MDNEDSRNVINLSLKLILCRTLTSASGSRITFSFLIDQFPVAFSNMTERPLYHLAKGDRFFTVRLNKSNFREESILP